MGGIVLGGHKTNKKNSTLLELKENTLSDLKQRKNIEKIIKIWTFNNACKIT